MSQQSGQPELTVRAAQAEVDASIQALGGYWRPLANLARLIEECGELARGVNQRYGPKIVKPQEAATALAEELGDVLYVALVLANNLEIDATSALAEAIAKARRRAMERGSESATPQGAPIDDEIADDVMAVE